MLMEDIQVWCAGKSRKNEQGNYSDKKEQGDTFRESLAKFIGVATSILGCQQIAKEALTAQIK